MKNGFEIKPVKKLLTNDFEQISHFYLELQGNIVSCSNMILTFIMGEKKKWG